MNVCFIGKHIYPGDVFSNEQDMKTWRSMAAYFGELFVIAQSPDLFFHRAKEKNICVYLVPRLFGYFGFILFAAKLGFFLNLKYSIDVFDASEVAGGGIAATFLKFLTGRLSVIEVQGEVFRKPEKHQNLKSWLLQKIGKWTMQRAARIRVISRAIYNQVLERGIDERKIRLVSLRVDLDNFNPDKFKLSENRSLVVGYVGRLVDGKGLEDLLQAISIIKGQIFPTLRSGSSIFQPNQKDLGEIGTNFKLLIFGSGPLEEKLKKMAQNLGISDLIEWRGFVPYGGVPEALLGIDVFVYPSWHEGFGRSIMEALAMEKAVVATEVGGIPDLIEDGKTGFLIPPHNSEQLAVKIKELLSNEELRKKFGKAGREWVSKNYEWNDGIKKFDNLFLELK